jgi:hypothetical protein
MTDESIMPTKNAKRIIPDSNQKLWMMLTPKIDKPERNTGKMAQCTAQAREAPIPMKSALIFRFMNDLQR